MRNKFPGLLVGYIALRDRRNSELTGTKKILIIIVASLFLLAVYLTVIKQVNEINNGYTSFNCTINDYTKSCQRKCLHRNVTQNCPVSFCEADDRC